MIANETIANVLSAATHAAAANAMSTSTDTPETLPRAAATNAGLANTNSFRERQARRRRRRHSQAPRQLDMATRHVPESVSLSDGGGSSLTRQAADSHAGSREDGLTELDVPSSYPCDSSAFTGARALSISDELATLTDDMVTDGTAVAANVTAGSVSTAAAVAGHRSILPQQLFIDKGSRFRPASLDRAAGKRQRSDQRLTYADAAMRLAYDAQRLVSSGGRLWCGLLAGLAVGHAVLVLALWLVDGGGGGGGVVLCPSSVASTGPASAAAAGTMNVTALVYSRVALPFKLVFAVGSLVCAVFAADGCDPAGALADNDAGVEQTEAAESASGRAGRALLAWLVYLAAVGVSAGAAPVDDALAARWLFRQQQQSQQTAEAAVPAPADVGASALLTLACVRAVLLTLGWCLIAAAGAGHDRLTQRLQRLCAASAETSDLPLSREMA